MAQATEVIDAANSRLLAIFLVLVQFLSGENVTGSTSSYLTYSMWLLFYVTRMILENKVVSLLHLVSSFLFVKVFLALWWVPVRLLQWNWRVIIQYFRRSNLFLDLCFRDPTSESQSLKDWGFQWCLPSWNRDTVSLKNGPIQNHTDKFYQKVNRMCFIRACLISSIDLHGNL